MNKDHMSDTLTTLDMNAFERFTKRSVWPAYAGFWWALLYAVLVRFYEAAAGIIGGYGQLSDPRAFSMASYGAGVLIMICGFILLGLVKPWGLTFPVWVPHFRHKRIPRLFILIPTLFSSAMLIAHGTTGIVTKTLFLIGAIPLELQGWAVIDKVRLAIWDLCFYEPWFLIMGILSGLAAAYYAHASGVMLPRLRQWVIRFVLVVSLLTSLLIASIVLGVSDILSF
ncbi:hypothetical protein FHS19_001478 [Paenibacillus rhizosphaerae]|uniref:DUF3995 domain-containing protein n=1 Tax=Paenibacillus rhizosphaerae TaxID=297318 RepID=A0A839TJA3_9BACL|nr:DUF3995 domain-containing protein [Paenibacillus rhizosphaerae]MBB3126824.1 hypothetical protein [Paenibacillus rhizosphaerae]